MSSQDDENDAAVTWGSFFDDEYQNDFDGCDGAMGGGSNGVEQQLLDDSSRVTDSDDKGPHVDPSADEDTDSRNGFGDLLREGIGDTPDILWWADELPEGASVLEEINEQINEQDVANFERALNLKDDTKFAKQEASGSKNQKSSHSKTSIHSLRQWIERATGKHEYMNTVISSPAYIASAIKIAIDLTTQIIDAEDLYMSGVRDKLDMLPLSAAHDWAEHVVVQDDTESSSASKQHNINAKVDEFLHQFEQQRQRQIMCHDNARASEQAGSARTVFEGNSMHPPDSTPNSDCCIGDASCLNVRSAQIQCPEDSSDSPSNPDTENAHMQRMFYLGLVFYELFSGGQRPPSKLCALASSECAFESLSTATLAQNGNGQDHFIGANKRLQSVHQNGGPCRIYCEYLKLSNVTNSLCHLILNMLDCVCGVFAGKDTYSHLREVQFDLQLMLDKPKILRGLNMDTLSSQSKGSQLDEISISREQEVQSILSCYRRCMSGSFEIAFFKGGIFLMGKFDQMQQSRPFSGLAEALDQYCALLIDQLGSDWVNTLVNKLQSALGRDASYLIKIIPKLSAILDHNATYSPPDDHNVGNAVQRIQYLLCLFVETISSSSALGVTLCLDDVQWMDAASISVVKRVLAQGYNKFFFMACCRHDEMSDTHPFWGMIDSVCSNGTLSVSVELKNIDANMLENVISEFLCLSPRLVKPLASISAHDGLLRVDFGSQRWVWDQDKIRAAKLPDNVALCFTNGIAKLPSEVQVALHTLSTFGSSVKSKCIKALETHQNINLTEPLQIAMKEGLVSKVAGSYHFSHDWIQETCYSFVNHQDRALNHLTYGRCLSKLAQETNNDDMMFTSANQINLGGPEAITDANECITMASFNLMVGKKAIETSDFSLAHRLFSSGIKFLPQQHWRYHYDISLELYELAAKAALATSNIDEIPLLSETVLKHARCFDDELNIHQIVILSLMQSSKLNEALEMGMNVLSQLGEGISRNQLDLLFYLDVKRTQAMISGLTEDAVLGYRPMTDKKKQAAMKILSCIHRCSFLALAAPPLCRCIILKMVQVTIKYGLSNQSPIAFALFGVLLSTMGNIPVGRRFSLLAMALLNKLESRDNAGEVMYLVARVSCLVEPFQAVIDLHTRAELASLVAGDVQHACINRGTRSVIKFSTGAKLEDVNRGISQALLVVKMQEFNTVLFLLMSFQWLVLTLMGNEADADLNARASEQNDTNPRQLMLASTCKLFVSYLFSRDDTKECGETYYELKLKTKTLAGHDQYQLLLPGLAAFRLYRQTKDSKWLKRGKGIKEEIANLSEKGKQMEL
ncbi:hypothetical protein ACHAWO_006544 [Cyclotella atomus]|uniref:Orc1-like AAA ATPase domain-containing protein n=1 Tax=Cyclotella atomus TaxID=382360 RepID=A0ABD3MWD6_9STRA